MHTNKMFNMFNFQIPLGCTEVHHEIELGVVIGSRISRATPNDAFSAVGGYALVLDMTARDLQVNYLSCMALRAKVLNDINVNHF